METMDSKFNSNIMYCTKEKLCISFTSPFYHYILQRVDTGTISSSDKFTQLLNFCFALQNNKQNLKETKSYLKLDEDFFSLPLALIIFQYFYVGGKVIYEIKRDKVCVCVCVIKRGLAYLYILPILCFLDWIQASIDDESVSCFLIQNRFLSRSTS
jgi:hypothetical protein